MNIFKSSQVERFELYIIIFISFYIFFNIVNNFLPMQNGHLGHDYIAVLTQYLHNYFWLSQNSFLDFPLFSPAFCGGIPNVPSGYYSLPQLLTLWLEPLSSVKTTIFLFSFIGFIGTYMLLNICFKLNRFISLLGAILFLFNGYLIHRYIIGHFAFNPHSLIPLFSFLLISYKTVNYKNIYQKIAFLLILTLFFTYFLANLFLEIIPFLISVIGVLILHSIKNNINIFIYFKPLLIIGMLSIFIMSFEHVAIYSMGKSFSRDFYRLAGFDSFLPLLWFYLKSLFFFPDMEMVSKYLTNKSFSIQKHEWETSISAVPLVIFIIALLRFNLILSSIKKFTINQKLLTLLLVTILFIPIILNFYQSNWNALIKSIPFIGSISSFTRWLIINIPIVIVLSCLVLNKLNIKNYKLLVIVFIGYIFIYNLNYDRTFYEKQGSSNYYKDILESYNSVKNTGQIPHIKAVAGYRNKHNQVVYTGGQYNLLFLKGYSGFYCYNSFFGYRCEKFPKKELRLGPVNKIYYKDSLNLKNPACYLYPKENECEPGDHFKADQIDELNQFINYRPISYKKSTIQIIADFISISTFISVVLTLFGSLILMNYKKKNN